MYAPPINNPATENALPNYVAIRICVGYADPSKLSLQLLPVGSDCC